MSTWKDALDFERADAGSVDATDAETDTVDPTGLDRPVTGACYRCDRPLMEDRVIHLSAVPCRELASWYERVTRAYCPSCVAAIGMLAFAEARGNEPVESD